MKTDDLHGNKSTLDNSDIHESIPNNGMIVNSYRQYIIDMVKNIYDPVLLKCIYELTCKYYNHR